MKCYYHSSDLDGHCSGAIVLNKHPECEMIGVNYNETLNKSDITDGETVYIVDFSFSADVMEWLNLKADLIWIDHHKSAIEKCDHIENIRGIREIGKAGCELTWEFLHPNHEIPHGVWLLGRYDVWDHEDINVLPFQYGIRNQGDTRPESENGSELWFNILSDFTDIGRIIDVGLNILRYQAAQDAMYAKGMSYEAEFHGYNVIVMNKAYSNSKIFDSVYDPDKHDFMILFGVKPGEIKYSLYCDKPEIDVSAIAVQYGGGGHKGAAGFYSDKIIL